MKVFGRQFDGIKAWRLESIKAWHSYLELTSSKPIVWEAVGLHRIGRGVTDFVRKLHENTIKAKATVLTFLAS